MPRGVYDRAGRQRGLGLDNPDRDAIIPDPGPGTGEDPNYETLGGIPVEDIPQGGAGGGEAAGGEAGGPKARKTRAKRGTGAIAQAKKSKNSLEGIERMLYSIHAMGATMLKAPELMLAPEEAQSLAAAIGQVAEHYDLGMSETALAWTNLAMVAGTIYGTRVFAYAQRTKAEEKVKKEAKATSLPFNFESPVK
jgi:hypothetical protein